MELKGRWRKRKENTLGINNRILLKLWDDILYFVVLRCALVLWFHGSYPPVHLHVYFCFLAPSASIFPCSALPQFSAGHLRSTINPLLVKLPKSRITVHLHSFVPLFFSSFLCSTPVESNSTSSSIPFPPGLQDSFSPHYLRLSPIQNHFLFYPH